MEKLYFGKLSKSIKDFIDIQFQPGADRSEINTRRKVLNAESSFNLKRIRELSFKPLTELIPQLGKDLSSVSFLLPQLKLIEHHLSAGRTRQYEAKQNSYRLGTLAAIMNPDNSIFDGMSFDKIQNQVNFYIQDGIGDSYFESCEESGILLPQSDFTKSLLNVAINVYKHK